MLAQTRARSAARRAPRIALVLTLFAAVALLLLTSAAAAAPGDTIWTRQLSTGPRGDAFLDVARGPGDVYYCAGIARATEETSLLLLVKYKADGTKLWSRTWQSASAKGAAAAQVAVARDGDVVVAGTVGAAPPASARGRNVVVLRYAPSGKREWVRVFDGPGHKDDTAAGLALDGAGAAFVAGMSRGASTGQDYLVLCVTPAGAVRWFWTYDGPSVRDYATGVAVDGGGNCYVTGSSQGRSGTLTAATAKLSRRGAKVWLKRLQYGAEGHSSATALAYRRVSGDRRLFLTGSAEGLMATRQDLIVAQVDADTGSKLHHAAVDGGGADDGGDAIAVDASGNAYAAGYTTDATSAVVHAFLVRMSADGSIPWAVPFWLDAPENEAHFGTVDLDAAGNPVCGGYGLVAAQGPEALVASFWPTNGLRWINVSSGSGSGDDICRRVLARASGVFAAGQITRTGSGVDGQLKKMEP